MIYHTINRGTRWAHVKEINVRQCDMRRSEYNVRALSGSSGPSCSGNHGLLIEHAELLGDDCRENAVVEQGRV